MSLSRLVVGMRNNILDKRDRRVMPTGNKHQQKGSLLIVVIWLLVILAMMAVGLSRRTKVDLALTKYAVSKLKSRYIAQAGFQYTLAKIRVDSKDRTTQFDDTLWQCGIKLENNQTAKDVFKDKPVPDGAFNVGYLIRTEGNQAVYHWGLQDEERRLNLNSLNVQNYQIFKNLLLILGVEDALAESIAKAAADWRDVQNEEDQRWEGDGGRGYPTALSPYRTKRRAFDNVEELLLLDGMTPGIFERVKHFVTVFPKGAARLMINFNTAPREVLQALGRTVTGALTNTTVADADSLAGKIVQYRKGNDGEAGTGDDRLVEAEKMALNNKERVVFLTMFQYMTRTAQFLRINVTGIEQKSGVHSSIEAVVSRSDMAVLLWKVDSHEENVSFSQ